MEAKQDSYIELGKLYVFQRMTGLDVSEFQEIVSRVYPLWKKSVEFLKKSAGRWSALKTFEDKVMALLIYYRTYITHEFIGHRKVHSRTRPRKLNGEEEAQLVAICCSEAPSGRVRWTMKLLAHQLIELEIVDKISPETVLPQWKQLTNT